MRPFLALLGVVSAIFGVPWLTILSMGFSAFRYPAYEMMLVGLLTDFLWLPVAPFHFPLFTIAGLILVWGLEPLRKEFLFS